MQFTKNLISFGDRRFVLLRVIPIDDKPNVNTWKEHLFADIVLKKDNKYFFCQEILDAEVLERPKLDEITEHKKETSL